MEQIGSSNRSIIRILIDLFKGIVTDIGVFTNTKAYKEEIARYEGELPKNASHANASPMDVGPAEPEAAVS
jgi:hypothetical protein